MEHLSDKWESLAATLIENYNHRAFSVANLFYCVLFTGFHWLILWSKELFVEDLSDSLDYNPYRWLFVALVGGNLTVFCMVLVVLVLIEKTRLINAFHLFYQPFRGLVMAGLLFSNNDSIIRIGLTFDFWFLLILLCGIILICPLILLCYMANPYLKSKLSELKKFYMSTKVHLLGK